jgi:predicted NBD/HSP70 family sugar kinase
MTRSQRATNLARTLGAALAAATPQTRADLAVTTSTTRATASRLVDDLVAGGLLQEQVRPDDARRPPGRPGTPLAPGRGVAALGLQVDVDRVAAVVVDLAGEVRAEHVQPGDHRASRPAPVLARLARLAHRALDDARGLDLVGAGLALPGLVGAGPTLLRAPNLGWSGVDLGRLPPPLDGDLAPAVGNEADLAALTVAYAAPGRPGDLADFVYLSGSTGIGGAVVVDGRPVVGRHGWAGEVGHVTVDPDGPVCACGSTGCLELYAGARALASAAGLAGPVASAELARLVEAGDASAVAAVEGAARALGIALSTVVNVLDVPVVVLGGHLRELGEQLRPALERTLSQRVLSASWAPPRVVVAERHPLAPAVGAALGRLQALVADPQPWCDARSAT